MLDISVVFLGIVLTALFSTFETAMVSGDPLKIYVRVRNRERLRQFMEFFQNPGKSINSLIVMINVVDITVAIFVLKFFREHFPIVQAALYATVFTVLVSLVFGELIPKGIALAFPQFVIFHFFPFIRYLIIVSTPVILFLDRLTRIFFPKIWKERGNAPIRRSDIEFLFHENSNFQTQHLVEMVYRVLSIDDIRVKETKIPISEVVGFSQDMTVGELQKELTQDYYSRIPIYGEDIFDIVGYVDSKDILFAQDLNQTVIHYRKGAVFFPENKPVDEVIEGMEAKSLPVAFVVDEFGAVSGMVTKNNLVEVIIGGGNQGEDGHDRGLLVKNRDGWIVSGRQDIDELNDRLGLGIKKDGFETLAGFMLSWFREIPHAGDSFVYRSFFYQVKEMQKFFVSKVEITRYVHSLDEEEK